ncbi:ATP-binding protein [Candidatus Omnitrophota bacterium]
MKTVDVKMSGDRQTKNLLRDFLNKTLKDMMSVLGAECGSLFLIDYANENLVLDSLYNSGQLPSIKGLRIRKGEGISGKVVDMEVPVLVRDIDHDPRFRKNGYRHYQTKSFISIPLFASKGKRLVGVINIADKSNKEPFSEKDFKFVVSLCRYACLNIDGIINHKRPGSGKHSSDKQNVALEKYASVGKLATGVVHEINNPLDGILRYTNMLLTQMENDSVDREYLLEIKKGLNRIGGITKSLLEFSYMVNSSSSKMKLKKSVDIHEIIDESIDMLSNKIPCNIQISKKYKDKLPNILDLGLSHVFMNLIRNALDAMVDGGRLEISTDMNDSAIEISFKDTGHGIPKSIRKNIFEAFFTTKSIDKGTGLGLAICDEIIRKYDGRIHVQSIEGRGSNFTILIPKD